MNNQESELYPISATMIKLTIQIQLVRLSYQQLQQKGHYIQFSIENKEDQELNYDQSYIGKGQNMVELDKLSPLQIYLVIGENKRAVCPFSLYFTAKLVDNIKRKIPINSQQLLQHYLQHQIFQSIQPLQQLYSFDGGEIVYFLNIINIQKLSNNEEILQCNSLFRKRRSVIQPSLRTSRNQGSLFKQKQTEIQTNPRESKMSEEYGELPETPTLRPKTSLNKMSIEEIAEQLEMQKEESPSKISQSMLKSGNWYIKLGQKEAEVQKIQLLKSSNFKLKLVVLLLIIGAMALMSDVTFGIKNKSSSSKDKKHVKMTKSRKSRHSRVWLDDQF